MNAYRSFGLFGLILLMFGLLAGLITSAWTSRYVLVHLIFGGALLALYLFTHIESLKESVSGRKSKYGTNTIVRKAGNGLDFDVWQYGYAFTVNTRHITVL